MVRVSKPEAFAMLRGLLCWVECRFHLDDLFVLQLIMRDDSIANGIRFGK